MLKRKVQLIPIIKAEEKEPVAKKEYEEVIKPIKLDISDTASLVFSISKVKGDDTPYVDIRTYIDTEKYSGPTKKGINFNIEYLDEMVEILRQLRDSVEV